jgi:hypothetical protein
MNTDIGWVIDEGTVDPTNFFEILTDTFPEATTFFVEGTSMEEDVIDCYLRHLQPGKYLPSAHTLWPDSRKIRCFFDKAFFKELALLSERYAMPELLDHLLVYKEKTALLEWPDAFYNEIFLSSCLAKERVAALAKQLNLPYTRWDVLCNRRQWVRGNL